MDQTPLDEAQTKAALVVRKLQQMKRTEGYHFFEPQDYQRGFDECVAPRILIHGGNRSGKTMHVVRRALRIMEGKDPMCALRGWEPPIYVRMCGAGMTEQVLKVLVEWFRKMTPRSWLEKGEFKFNSQTGLLRFSEDGPCRGGWVEFMSYDQDPEKGSGRPLHVVVFDEAYKCSERFRNQGLSRLIDYHGMAISIETPEDGDATWSVKWYERASEGDSDYEVFRYPTRKNKYLYPEEDRRRVSPQIEQIVKDCDGDELQIRIRLDGDFVSIGGLVYQMLDRGKHVLAPEDFGVDSSWTRYVDIDPGIRKPHRVTWHLVGPGKRVYFYRDAYIEGTMEDMCLAIRDLGGLEQYAAFNFDPHWDWDNKVAANAQGQPFNLQRALAEAMRKTGYGDVSLTPARKDPSMWFGIDQVAVFLRQDPASKRPNMAFSPECDKLYDEMRRYSCVRPREKEPTAHRPRIRKIDDDGPDCVRIAITSRLEYLGGTLGAGSVITEDTTDEFGIRW